MFWDKLASKLKYSIGAANRLTTPVRAEIRYRSQIDALNEDLSDLDLTRDIHDELAWQIADEMLTDLGFKEDTAKKLRLVDDLSVESIRNLVKLAKALGRFSPEEVQRVLTIYFGLCRLGEEKLHG